MIRIGFLQLSSCSGCLFSVLGSVVFPDIIKTNDVRLFRMVSEVQSIEHFDVVFIEGGVAEEEEAELLRKLYKDGSRIVALGTCAALGGVMSKSQNISVEPVGKYVDVQTTLPGCPPPQRLLGSLLLAASEGAEMSLPDNNVCAECPFTKDQDYSTEIRLLQPITPPKSCFLREGVLCLGPVTRAGCEALCVKGGAPCDGCFGSLNRDMPSAIANLFSVMQVSPDIREYSDLAFRYQKPDLRSSE